MLSKELLSSTKQYLDLMESTVQVSLCTTNDDEESKQIVTLFDQLQEITDKIEVIKECRLSRTPSFLVGKNIVFAGVPEGEEFSSLILALLHVSGRKPKYDDDVLERVQNLKGYHKFDVYISNRCKLCSEIVQFLNAMTTINGGCRTVIIDQELFPDEADKREVYYLPSIWHNGKFFGSGNLTCKDILGKLEGEKVGTTFVDGSKGCKDCVRQ